MWPFTCGAVGCPGRRECPGCPTVGQRLDRFIARVDWELRHSANAAVFLALVAAAVLIGWMGWSEPWSGFLAVVLGLWLYWRDHDRGKPPR